MEKIIYSIGLLAIMLFSAFDSAIELYPLDVPSAETFYTNETELQGGVNACYSFLTEARAGSYFSPEYSFDAITDVLFIRGGGFSQNILESVLDNKEPYFRTIWLSMYQGVGRCNLILQKIEENKDKISAEKVKQFQGEVYFLRAYYYLRLINMFGDVVYLDKPVTTVAEGKNAVRTDKAEVLQKIYADFDKSAELLAESTVKDLGRATSGAALAFKARAALQQNDWATAATTAKLVIDLKKYSLMPSYATLFNASVINSPANTEQILTQGHLVTAGNAHAFLRFAGPRSASCWSTIVPTQNMVDSYLCTDGQDISESPLYDKGNPYENRDPRMRYSLVLPGDMWNGYIYDTRQDKPQTLNAAGQLVKNPDSYASTAFTSFTGYLLRKYVDWSYITVTNQCENPFMICRYAEVLLTYAEAKIELDQIDDDCLKAINDVRGRSDVNMPIVPSGLSQDEMRKIVRTERKVELFCENLHWQDLLRWERAEVVLNRPIFGRPVLGEFSQYPSVQFDEMGDPVYDDASYVPHPSTDYRVLIRPNFKPRDYLWPIPETEYNLNNNLGQNDGWQ